MKRTVGFLVVLLSGFVMPTGLGAVSADQLNTSVVESAEAYTEVEISGQRLKRIEVKVQEDSTVSLPAADDFLMKGKATNWMDPSLHDFTAEVSKAEMSEDGYTLYFEDFPDKYFYVDSFQIICSSQPGLSFTNEYLTAVHTPIADEFEDGVFPDTEYAYHLFTPQAEEDISEPLPLVIVFHGYEDTNNLLTYRTSVEWAEEENQRIRPCYVLSPVIEKYTSRRGRTEVYDCVKIFTDSLVDEGLVDASRIYVMGNSFGGAATIEFLERFPDVPAAALSLCPALSYFDSDIFKDLPDITQIPIWFAHAEHDQTISADNSRTAFVILEKNGATENKITIYTDEEMDAAGAFPSAEATVSYHHVEVAVMPDPAYAEWLFSKKRER